jgi:signal transduction histidine kinase
MDQKENVAAAILRARAELDHALEELEKVPAYHSEAVSYTAHALNNYLTVSAGTVGLLMTALANHPNPEIKTWLDGLRQATQLMARTVTQLVTAAPLPAGKLNFEAVNLPVLVGRLCAYYQSIAHRKQITLFFEAGPQVPLVRADRLITAAILDNLFSNAIKFSTPGKRIWIVVRGDSGGAVCSIRDEGPGLSDEDQAKLFQKGVRLTPTPTGGEPSSGYGLAVARELTGQLGGRLWCESRLGQGACFSLGLPAFPEAAPTAAPSPPGGHFTGSRAQPNPSQ